MQTNKQQKNKRQHYMQNMTLQQRKILNKITTPKPTHKQRTKQWHRRKQITKNSQTPIRHLCTWQNITKKCQQHTTHKNQKTQHTKH